VTQQVKKKKKITIILTVLLIAFSIILYKVADCYLITVLVKNSTPITDFENTAIDKNFGNRSIQDANPRTGVGIISSKTMFML